jgi:hypothetical protein
VAFATGRVVAASPAFAEHSGQRSPKDRRTALDHNRPHVAHIRVGIAGGGLADQAPAAAPRGEMSTGSHR